MIITIAGTIIAVTDAIPSAYTNSGYGELTYTNIGNISDGGEHGIEYNIVTFNSISTRNTQKFKGSFDYGLKTLEIAYDPTDSGAVLLRNGSTSLNDYAFKITYQDGTVEYFSAKVKSFNRTVGTVNSMRMITVALDVTNLIDGEDVVITESYFLSGTDMLLAGTGELLLIG